jgi:hypothetical protein
MAAEVSCFADYEESIFEDTNKRRERSKSVMRGRPTSIQVSVKAIN